MFRFAERLSSLTLSASPYSFGFLPLAGISAGDPSFDPILFGSGLAVLSAGLLVLHAAHSTQPAPAVVAVAPRMAAAAPPPVPIPAEDVRTTSKRRLTAEEALAEREIRASDREVLLNALAQAAETFYAIAGHLPREASDRALGKADDLRELVWLNRARAG